MKRSLMILAVSALLAVPVFVSAEGETRVPPEVRWSPTPPTPPIVAVDKERTVSTMQEQISADSKVGNIVDKTGYLGGYDPTVAQGE